MVLSPRRKDNRRLWAKRYSSFEAKVIFVLVSRGHIDNHMPASDGSCGIQTHDSWIIEAWPLLTAPSVQTIPCQCEQQ